ncbi:MAG: CDP-glucose 4,6-dehydratase [Candidatus Scalindua sediminis]|nr:CDP-glucose 4,6-dehydratase [Candidatus Scalindua sediminis]
MEYRSGKMEYLVMEELFSGIYKDKTILITGHTGFKGSWLTLWLKQLGAEVTGYSLKEHPNSDHFFALRLDVRNIFADIRDRDTLLKTIAELKPDIIFHLAAQSLVRESYRDPAVTYETNVIGTLNVLEAVRNCESVSAVINVTSDKVYENREWGRGYRETDHLGGYDPYSSSKACSEILTSSYRNSFFEDNDRKTLIASARAGNVIGGGDWAQERLLPDIAKSVIEGNRVKIRSPKSVRPWQHVLEPLSGYLLLGQKLLEGKREFASAWNFGPENSSCINVQEVTKFIRQYWDKVEMVIDEEQGKFHEAGLLKLDSSKASLDLDWAPVWDIDKTVKKTVEWYDEYITAKKINSDGDIVDYVNNAKAMELPWC